MTVNKEQLKSASEINKGIASLSRSKIKDTVQHLATLIVIHAVKYDDISAADRLCATVKNLGMRNDSLGKWFVETGCARIKEHKDAETGKATKSFGMDKAKQAALADRLAKDGLAKVATELKAKSWDDAKKAASSYDGFDLDKLIESLCKRADKAIKEHGDHPDTKIDRDTLARLKSIKNFAKPEQAVPNLWAETTPAVN